MIPHVVLCLAYQRERMAYQDSSSNPYIVMQWCSDTISEMITLVISLIRAVVGGPAGPAMAGPVFSKG